MAVEAGWQPWMSPGVLQVLVLVLVALLLPACLLMPLRVMSLLVMMQWVVGGLWLVPVPVLLAVWEMWALRLLLPELPSTYPVVLRPSAACGAVAARVAVAVPGCH